MRDELAKVVFPVLNYGLRLKDRLEHGDEPDLHAEQATLRKLLKGDAEARRWPDYGGQGADAIDISRTGSGSRPTDRWLGARYALACWLDEIFILDTSWESAWNEQKIEEALYGQNERAYKFWEQVRMAESRVEADALEVFYLCVMLGFRGELRDHADRLRAWRDATEAQINKGQQQKWPGPQEQQPATNVPPLRGRDKLRRVMLAVGLVIALLVPAAAFYVVNQLGK